MRINVTATIVVIREKKHCYSTCGQVVYSNVCILEMQIWLGYANFSFNFSSGKTTKMWTF